MALVNRTHCPPTLRLFCVASLVLLSSAGCKSTWNTWQIANDKALAKGPTAEELGDSRGLMARWMSPKIAAPTSNAPGEKRSPIVLGSDGWKPMEIPTNEKAEADYQAAERLFQQGQLAEAQAAFKQIVKDHKGTPWGEKGQFFLAETLFQRGKYMYAEDEFQVLINDYPGTLYRNQAAAREFAIAQIWLSQGDPKAKKDDQLAWTSHFTGGQPLIDTRGHALRTLEHVRQHDPDGPLSDDAVLKMANIYMDNRDYESAAMHFDQLTADHPKSPFVQEAHLSSIDARLKSYIGPDYDASSLQQARETIKQTMAAFPDRPEQNEKLYHILDLINDQEAERTYREGLFYKRTMKVTSAEFMFGEVRSKWPKSEWAEKAKVELASIAKMPRTETLPSKIMTAPGGFNSFGSGSAGPGPGGNGAMGGGMPGMGMMSGMGGMN